MNKVWRWKSSVILTVILITVLVPGAVAKKLYHAVAPADGDLPNLVGSTQTLLPDGRLLIVGGQDVQGRVQSKLWARDPITGLVADVGATLHFARAAHSATVLPDGTVLILGGVGQDGKIVATTELFDPISATVRSVTVSPTPRAFHTATLITDGRVLVAGGVFAGSASAKTLEVWDPRGKSSGVLPATSALARRNHSATLLPDGRVLFSGGEDENGTSVIPAQIFDPQSQTISSAATLERLQESGSSMTEMRASSPQDGALDVALDSLISVRFSKPVLMPSVSSTNLTLQGPDGFVSAKVVAAEAGMLAFITPASQLLPGTTYTVKIAGVVDSANQSVAYGEFSFSTMAGAPAAFDDERWTPTSDWRTHRGQSKYELLPDLEARRGTTALAGQVLKLNGEPLEHVTLEMGNRRTQSDSTGRFLLSDIPSGHQVLVIEGSTANSPGKQYGRFEFGDEVKPGVTNKLDFKIWMTLLDVAHEVTIASPTTKEIVVTTPTMPGLELHLPAGTVITDDKGKRVTKITITPIPVDRPPFPLPFVIVPTYFTIQPGGAYISVSGNGPKGARLFYPNTEHKPAGVPYAFWNYNPDHNGWSVYGTGHVNQTLTQVVPDPGVTIYDFSGAMAGSGGVGPSTGNPAPGEPEEGEPVGLSTGLFTYNKNDFVLPDVIPISLTRTYRPNDSWSRPFGIGTTHPYEIFIGGDGTQYGQTPYIDLILPDGQRIHFTGVGSAPYQTYLHSAAGTQWYGAKITTTPFVFNPNQYPLPGLPQLQMRDGTIYSFPEANGLANPGCQALLAITDRYGNQLKITRNTDANCTIAQVTSPSGRYVQFQYDSSYRVKVATDNIGRQVQYSYDASGRLQTVIDANNGIWTYGYDSLNRMTTIQDPRQITYLTNVYDSGGRVYQQYLADGTSFYQFNWTTTSNTTNVTFTASSGSGGPAPYQVLNFRSCSTCNEGFAPLITQVDVIDPRGYTRRVTFNQNGYPATDILALGKPEQQTTTYSYFADNLLSSVTDQLGRVTSYNYDVNGNPTSITQLSGTPNAVTTNTSYDSIFSNPLTTTDPLGNTTTYVYDSFGNLITSTDPLGHQTTFSYNGMGLLLSVTDALQHTTQFSYDLGDLTGVTDPLLNTTSMFRDGAGRTVTRTDPLGHTIRYQYNPLDQITQISDPLQGITSLTYDVDGNLQSFQDARQQGTNNKTLYTYDNFDHLQSRTDPLGRQDNYAFDQLSNLTSFTDRRGKVTTYQYDGISRRTFAGYGTLPGPSYESTVNYTYDGGNRVQTLVDSSAGTITRNYDSLNRLSSEVTSQGTVSYSYDNNSRLISTTVSGQPSSCYSYDNASRLIAVGQGTCPTSTSLVVLTYDNANRRNTLTVPNGIVLSYGYDANSHITSMAYQLGSANIGSLNYQYDAIGRRIQAAGSLASTAFPQNVSSATYDVANELTNWNGSAIAYDSNGNVVNDGVASYTWNARNQLLARGVSTFSYDPLGRRTVNASGTNLLYEGWNVAQELAGTTPVANRIAGSIDEFYSRADSTGTYSPVIDTLGSILALTNSTGTISSQYAYDPFGNTTVSGGTSTNVFQYAGRENDGNGLYFYRGRYYYPTWGRFISEDPLEFWGGGPNAYVFEANDPVNRIDPFGLCWIYSQSNGAMSYADPQTGVTTLVSPPGVGYSGFGYGLNDPESQSVGLQDNVPNNVGPIPQGEYTIGPAGPHMSWRKNNLQYSMALTPAAGNNMFGRGGFLIHGGYANGSQTASSGCIILPIDVRRSINESSDRCLDVIP
jgi:RHS repeat-associated protein